MTSTWKGSKIVYMTDWANIVAIDPAYKNVKVRYYIIKNLNDFTYDVKKSYNFDSGAYWPVGDNPNGHPTEKDAKQYLALETRTVDKGPGMPSNAMLKCKVCGTRWDPSNWSRSEVREGYCPDCGCKGEFYTQRRKSRMIKPKPKRCSCKKK